MMTAEVKRKNSMPFSEQEPSEQELKEMELDLMDDDVELLETDELNEQEDNSGYNDNALSQYLKQIGQYPLLSADEEIELSKRVHEGDQSARDLMIVSNLRLVVSIAKKYTVPGIDLIDMIEEGTEGLFKAIDRFDYTKGYKFSTYATWWIRQGITRYIYNTSSTIRIPVYMRGKISSVQKSIKHLTAQNGYEPSVAEIMEDTGYDQQTVSNALKYSENIVSLDQVVGDDDQSGGTTLGDFIESNRADGFDNPEKIMIQEALSADIDKCMEGLTDKEKDIISKRYGLYGMDVMTLQDIGDEYHVSRERIRQIEDKVMRKLKFRFSKNEMREYLQD